MTNGYAPEDTQDVQAALQKSSNAYLNCGATVHTQVPLINACERATYRDERTNERFSFKIRPTCSYASSTYQYVRHRKIKTERRYIAPLSPVRRLLTVTTSQLLILQPLHHLSLERNSASCFLKQSRADCQLREGLDACELLPILGIEPARLQLHGMFRA